MISDSAAIKRRLQFGGNKILQGGYRVSSLKSSNKIYNRHRDFYTIRRFGTPFKHIREGSEPFWPICNLWQDQKHVFFDCFAKYAWSVYFWENNQEALKTYLKQFWNQTISKYKQLKYIRHYKLNETVFTTIQGVWLQKSIKATVNRHRAIIRMVDTRLGCIVIYIKLFKEMFAKMKHLRFLTGFMTAVMLTGYMVNTPGLFEPPVRRLRATLPFRTEPSFR